MSVGFGDKSHSRRVALALLAAGIAAALPLLAGCDRNSVEPGSKFTTLEVTPLTADAAPVSPATVAGKVVVVNFWATWCPPCVGELPYFAALDEQYGRRDDFQLLSISLDDDRQTVVDFMHRKNYRFDVYGDPSQATRRGLPPDISLDGIPVTLLVDREGTIVRAWYGALSEKSFAELKLQVASLLQR